MKKNIKKIIALLAVGALCLSLMACGSSGSDDAAADADADAAVSAEAENAGDAAEEETDAEAEADTADDGVLVMATEATFPPYEYYDGDEIVGIDVEIAQSIADKLGMTLQVDDMDFGSIIVAVQSGKADIGAAGLTVTEEREENVNFTDSYSTGILVIIVPEDSDIQSVDDLDGAMIGVQESTTGHIYCEDDYGADHVTPYTTGASAVQALIAGKVDCVVIDNEPAKNFVAANEGLKILDTEYTVEDYAIAVSKDNDELRDQINEVLGEMQADGSLQAIIDKYINADE